jgi:poly-beta-1,6-N-acetyl-D-glucosamine biosynthesis protein PgaD
MDESRPGHPTRLPLIIDRPDLAHPVRRVVGFMLTLLCWGIWVGMWLVLLATLGYEIGFELPPFLTPQVISLQSFRALAHLLPYALAATAALLLAAYLFDRLKRRWAGPDERWRPVGLARLARDAALDPENIERWQQAQVLYVEHGPLGRVINASTEPPGPGQAA